MTRVEVSMACSAQRIVVIHVIVFKPFTAPLPGGNGGSTAAVPSGQGGATDSAKTTVATLEPRGDTGGKVTDTGVSCSAECDKQIALVCGSDGLTYLSECLLKFTGCLLKDETLIVAANGPCPP